MKKLRNLIQGDYFVVLWLLITAFIRYYDKVQTEKIMAIQNSVTSIEYKLDKVLIDHTAHLPSSLVACE